MSTTSSADTTTLDRFRGCLLGLAVGDALGTTLEFKSPGSFEPIDDMVGGGPFGLKPGYWTDDTSMALCLAVSLTETGGFDPRDQMERYVRWWREGYMSPTGTCFDIGITVRDALSRFERTGEPYSGSTDPFTAGNGSLMRLAPVPMFYASRPEEAISGARTARGPRTARKKRWTHAGTSAGIDRRGARRCGQGDAPLSILQSGLGTVGALPPGSECRAEIANGLFKHREPPDIKGLGYVIPSLEAALWAFHRSTNFRDGALRAVNLGDNADTTGAIYGHIADAYYGVDAIPIGWREKIASGAEIDKLAADLYEFSRVSQ